MSDQIPPPLGQQPQKKGLSKGCTIALIIGGAVFVLIVAAIILLYVKRDELGRWAVPKAVEAHKMFIMQANIEGIDTVAVNKVSDAFIGKINSEDFDFMQVQTFQMFISQNGTDTKVDSAEVEGLVQAMISCYPELAELYTPNLTNNSLDTTMMEEESE